MLCMFATVRIKDAQQRFCSVSIDVTKSVSDAAQLAALSAPPALQQCLQNCALYKDVRPHSPRLTTTASMRSTVL